MNTQLDQRKPTYDSIAAQYEQYAETAAKRPIEERTTLNLAGNPLGLTVLDLACGEGFFSRELLARGAAKVVGVDLSEAMIRLAKEKSKQAGNAIQFMVRDVCDMEPLGEFDLVFAAWLFNYAESPDQLAKMARTVAQNLKPSGRLVACTVDPLYRLEKSNLTKYGIHILREEPWCGGHRYHAEFVTQPPAPFTFYQWSRETYEQTLSDAGLTDIEWQKPVLIPSDYEGRPTGFWDDFHANSLQIGLASKKAEPTATTPAQHRNRGSK